MTADTADIIGSGIPLAGFVIHIVFAWGANPLR